MSDIEAFEAQPRPSRWMTIALGVVVHIPVLILLILAVATPGEPVAPILLGVVGVFVLVAIIVGLLHVAREGGLSEQSKVGWAAVIVAFNVISLPVYWWIHVVPSWRAVDRG